MFSDLPDQYFEFIDWSWDQFEPYYRDLADQDLAASNIDAWLSGWSRITEILYEIYQRLYVATTVDTTDQAADQAYERFLDEIYPRAQQAEQRLKEKLLASGLEPDGFDIPLRNMRAEADLYRDANVPLLAEELKLSSEYDKIIGAQTVEWEGQELTISQLRPVFQDPDRSRRERAWRLVSQRQLADREVINDLWVRLMNVRRQIAENAGLPDYRAYRWQQMLRFDYSPQDCYSFHQAIEQVVVPAANRIYQTRAHQLGLESVRPWDVDVDPLNRPPLRPYQTMEELKSKTAAIFTRVDPQLGAYFEFMRRQNLLDLDNRKGKAPGGYCTEFLVKRIPFIFANSVGLHDDVQTLLHEGGHAFHAFESAHLPYVQLLDAPMEFSEVASMGMELLASPYLTAEQGGFYTASEAARARIEYLDGSLRFWPYMAVVDAFQQWVYENHAAASDPDNCDARWGELWDRFMPGEDWSGLEQEKMTGWQRKLHIFQIPFYYVEYGLALLGAVQVWRNALSDQAGAVAAYRKALSLGGSASLPELYAAAGARFAFDAQTLGEAVALMEETIAKLEAVRS